MLDYTVLGINITFCLLLGGERRPPKRPGKVWKYNKNSILPAEERGYVYKSLQQCSKTEIPFKIVQKAVKFVVGCLNQRMRGVIAFGVGDMQEQQDHFLYGQVLGLCIDGIEKEIVKQFEYMKLEMIRTDPDQTLLKAEQECISLHLINVVPRPKENPLQIVEIEVDSDTNVCKGNVYIARKFKKNKDFKQVSDIWKHFDGDILGEWAPYIQESEGTKKLSWSDFMKHKSAIQARARQDLETFNGDKGKGFTVSL